MKLTFRQLEIFYAVAQNGHVTQSSEVLGISQSGISMAIQELEKALNTKLFERFGRNLILNENGRVLYKKAFKLLEEIRSIQSEFLSEDFIGQIIVGASQTVANYSIPNIVYSFSQKYKNSQIELKVANTEKIKQMVLNYEIDIGIVEGVVTDNNIIKEFWKKDRLCIVTNNNTLIEKNCNIKDLLKKSWIVRERGSGTRKLFDTRLKDKKIENFIEIGGFEAIKSILKKEINTFAYISEIAMEDDCKKLKEIKVEGIDLSRDFTIIYHKNKFKSKVLNEFIKFVKFDYMP